MLYIVLIVLAIIYIVLPIWVKILVFIVNAFVPDPIPFLDEIAMLAGMLVHLARINMILEFISEHKVLAFFLFLVLIALGIWGISALVPLIGRLFA